MFNTYEELLQVVEERRNDTLTISVDMGMSYSEEYEEAKKELAQAKALGALAGQQFLADNIQALQNKVASLQPEPNNIYIRFGRLPLGEWAALMKMTSATPIDQYEKVLPKTFIGIFGDNSDEAEPLATDWHLVSTESPNCILPGGSLHQVIQAFMTWQNSTGDVKIFPMKLASD